jgi:hypothetical protein
MRCPVTRPAVEVHGVEMLVMTIRTSELDLLAVTPEHLHASSSTAKLTERSTTCEVAVFLQLLLINRYMLVPTLLLSDRGRANEERLRDPLIGTKKAIVALKIVKLDLGWQPSIAAA